MNPAQPQPAPTTPNPKEDISIYLRLHEKLFKEAKEEYAKGDLIQAGEKLWGRSHLTAKRNRRNQRLETRKPQGLLHNSEEPIQGNR